MSLADIVRWVITQATIKADCHQWKVLNAIICCRTALLGGHIYRCSGCGYEQPRYNSCRNRHRPGCQGASAKKWLEARAQELLPVSYFHTVFTVPDTLHIVFLQNRAVMYDLLLKAVAETLRTVVVSRYGGTPGFFSVLHTWGQTLTYHPHVHCVIAGAVRKDDGLLKTTPGGYFLPVRILSTVFKAIFFKRLRKAHGKLKFHGNAAGLNNPCAFEALLNEAGKKRWVVYSKRPFATAGHVLAYLSRYTHRVAISPGRLAAFENGQVTFTYKDYARGAKRRKMTLEAPEFIRRFLLHVLPPRFVRIRHYGFQANASTRPAALGVTPEQDTSLPANPSVCPQCQTHPLKKHRRLKRILIELSKPRTIARSPAASLLAPRIRGAPAASFNSG
jgi:hypothetical protein